MASRDFTAFAGAGTLDEQVRYACRIAVYDDPASVPRVIVVEPADIASYLSEITSLTSKLAHEQGGEIPFAIIREIVENYIHASFIEPSISIFDHGQTIRFCDQGPGIEDKERALEVGTTSASEDMKRYIRGVGSGLPIVLQYMRDKGGSLSVEDNISQGTIVTISALPANDGAAPTASSAPEVSERGADILRYLAEHDEVGGVDLVRAYGGSQPTWSRELAALDKKGLTAKTGQKRHLTEAGRALAGSLDIRR